MSGPWVAPWWSVLQQDPCTATLINSETGYTAVGEFVASCALLVIALVGIYAAGQHGRCYKKDKGRFAKEVK